jgi:hypothetical protein
MYVTNAVFPITALHLFLINLISSSETEKICKDQDVDSEDGVGTISILFLSKQPWSDRI